MECALYEHPNWTKVEKKHGVHRRTLERRYNGVTISVQEAIELSVVSNKKLTMEQEKVLVKQIGKQSKNTPNHRKNTLDIYLGNKALHRTPTTDIC